MGNTKFIQSEQSQITYDYNEKKDGISASSVKTGVQVGKAKVLRLESTWQGG